MKGIISWHAAFRREAIRGFHVLNPRPDSHLFELWMKMQETALALRNHNATRRALAQAAQEAEDAYYTHKLGPAWKEGAERLREALERNQDR